MPYPKRIICDDALFARIWAQKTITTQAIANQFGVNATSVTKHAQKLGLPSRKGSHGKITDNDMFTRMWNAGVVSEDICRYFGLSRLNTVPKVVKRLGLTHRYGQRGTLTLEQFMEQEFAEKMRQDARSIRERSVRDEAEMRQPKV